MNTFITGSSKGIGFGIAESLENQGYKVIYHSKNSYEHLVNKNHEIFDLLDINNVEKSYENIFHKYNGINNLVLNAGMGAPEEFNSHTVKDIKEIFNVNLLSQIILAETHIKLCEKYKLSGRIIGISSIAGNVPKPYFPLYSTTKSAFTYYLKIMSQYSYASNLIINTVSPGSIKTDMTNKAIKQYSLKNQQSYSASENKLYREKNTLKRMGEVKDVSNLVSFLLSEKSNFINGQNIEVSGGYLYE